MKFIFIASLFLLTACQNWIRTAPPATVGSGIPIGYGGPQDYPPPSQTEEPEQESEPIPPQGNFGDVRCHSSQFEHFNQQIRNFLSTSFDPNQARYTIKCSKVDNRKGGFFIQGKVSFNGQKFDPQSQSQNLTVSSNSYLEIHIVDITGRAQTQAGQAIRMNIDSYASIIRGQDASLVFKDTKGKVLLNGSISANKHNQLVFTGQFEFQNFTTWNGSSQGYQGAIGTFRIPACRFFDCEEQALTD